MADKTIEELKKELEEQLAAAKAEIEALKADAQKNKDAQSRASAEAAEYKRKLTEKMTADEKAKAEAEEAAKQREAEYAASQETIRNLTKKITDAENKARLAAAGISADRAERISAMFEGEIPEAFFTELTGHIADHDKAAEAARVNGTGKPDVGGNGGKATVTKEQFLAMNLSEMTKFAAENPELYKEYTK